MLNTKFVNLQIPIPRKPHISLKEVKENQKKKLKKLESNLNSEANFNEYAKCKNTIEIIYEKNAEGVKIRSKC